METFKVGEIALIVEGPNAGHECVIVEPERFVNCEHEKTGMPLIGYFYIGEMYDSERYYVRWPGIIKKHPPSEEQDLGEWELCPWQPTKVLEDGR